MVSQDRDNYHHRDGPSGLQREGTRNYVNGHSRTFSSTAQERKDAESSSSSSSQSSSSSNSSSGKNEELEDPRKTPQSVKLQLDFFGEPITFLRSNYYYSATAATAMSPKVISNAMAAMDGFLLAVVSKGKTSIGGGMEAGIEAKSAHSVALSWAELLRHASVWNKPIYDEKEEEEEEAAEDGEEYEEDDEEDDDDMGENSLSCPMLGYVATVPLLVQTGTAYVKHIDTLLITAKSGPTPGLPPIQLYDLAVAAAAQKDNERLNSRERMHLQVLDYLLRDDHPSALVILLKILRLCPGDALALSLAMDLAQLLGDKEAALRAATSVTQYWNERTAGVIKPAIPGHSMATALMAVGLGVGGRYDEAEFLANLAMNRANVSGALATWAQVYIFDAFGRIAEGISACANFDGMRNYEGAGLLFFDTRLGGYGCRFALDREERGRGKSKALHLYNVHFDRILGYSGFADGVPWTEPNKMAPVTWLREPNKKMYVEDPRAWSKLKSIDGGGEKSGLHKIMRETFFKLEDKMAKKEEGGGTTTKDKELVAKGDEAPSLHVEKWEPTSVDVLTWLPPTPMVLSDATLLLLRFTLNGTISRQNPRWENARKAWKAMLEIHRKYNGSLHFAPLPCLAASLLFPPSQTGGDMIGNGRLAKGLWMLGTKLNLGDPQEDSAEEGDESTKSPSTMISMFIRERVDLKEPDFWFPTNDDESSKEWKAIVDHLYSAIDGLDDPEELSNALNIENHAIRMNPSARFQAWEFEARPLLEHAIVYAACKAGDLESLSIARSICSKGVTTRMNSPEEWWRYSIVLGFLGDQVASEDAMEKALNIGQGDGDREYSG